MKFMQRAKDRQKADYDELKEAYDKEHDRKVKKLQRAADKAMGVERGNEADVDGDSSDLEDRGAPHSAQEAPILKSRTSRKEDFRSKSEEEIATVER